jgi:hypothetical protein
MASFVPLRPAIASGVQILESPCDAYLPLKQFRLLFSLLLGSMVRPFGQPPRFATATPEFGT